MIIIPGKFEFDEFFNDHLNPKLKELDKIRRKIILNYSIIGIVLLSGFLFEAVTWMSLGILFVVIFIFFYTRYYGISFSYFDRQHQSLIVSSVSRFILPAYKYEQGRYIKLKELQNGLILTGFPEQYGGCNLIDTHIGELNFKLSEIISYSKNTNQHGNKESQNYFTGLAGVAHCQTDFNGEIIILSESALEGNLGHLKKDINISHQNDFISYFSSEKQFSEIITPVVWLKLKQYYDATKKRIILTINQHGIYAGIYSNRQSYILTQLFSSVSKKETSENYFFDAAFITEIFLLLSKQLYTVN